MSPWAWLAIASTAEVAWSQSLRRTDGFTRPVPTLLCIALAGLAVYPLTRAVQGIPVGTAYVVFTAIGALGAVSIGILAAGDPAGPARLAAIGLIVAGVVILRVAEG